MPDVGAIQVIASASHVLIRADEKGLGTLSSMILGAKLSGDAATITDEETGREKLRIERVARAAIPPEAGL